MIFSVLNMYLWKICWTFFWVILYDILNHNKRFKHKTFDIRMRRLLPVLCLSAFLATGCAATTREIKIQQPQPKPKIEEKIVQEEQAPVKEKKDPYTFRLSDNLQQ